MASQTTDKSNSPRVEARESGYSHAEEDSTRMSRWASILYLFFALAAPVLVYFGPDVMSPAAPVIANQALDGHLSFHPSSTVAARAVKPR